LDPWLQWQHSIHYPLQQGIEKPEPPWRNVEKQVDKGGETKRRFKFSLSARNFSTVKVPRLGIAIYSSISSCFNTFLDPQKPGQTQAANDSSEDVGVLSLTTVTFGSQRSQPFRVCFQNGKKNSEAKGFMRHHELSCNIHTIIDSIN